MIHSLLALTLFATAQESAAASQDQDWAQWRGPTRDGHYHGPAWPRTLEEGRLEKLWEVELDKSYSGPLVVGDRVFTTATVAAETEMVRAVDRATGETLWETEWEGSMTVPFFAARNGSWIRATPAFDGDCLYVAGMRDVLVCLDAETGETFWRVDFAERFGTGLPDFGFASSPLLLEDGLVTQAGASLVKLDTVTGDTLWRTLENKGSSHDSPFSSPVLVEMNGREQLLVLTRETMNGVDPDSGEVLWTQPVKAFRGMNILTPMAFGNTVFTAAYGGRAQLLSVDETDGTFEVAKLWDNPAQGYMSSPVEHEGHVYLFQRSNRFSCVRLSDGEVCWTSGPTGDDYWSLISQGDRMLALSNNGMLRLIAASPESYEVLGEVQVADSETWAHLAVSGDELFVRSLDGLSAWRWNEAGSEAAPAGGDRP